MPADPAQHPVPAQQHDDSSVSEPSDSTVQAERPYTRRRLYAGLIGRSWLWFIAGCLAITLLPMIFGWRPYVVESGSMVPRINVGDVILASPVSDRAQVLGRVIAFDSPSKKGEVITHRVIRFDGPRLVTKGDANRIADTGEITMSDVRGLGRLLVRWVGLPLIWLQTGQWLWLALFLASLWLAGIAVVRDHESEEDEIGSEPGDGEPPDGPTDSGGRRSAPSRSSVTLAAGPPVPAAQERHAAGAWPALRLRLVAGRLAAAQRGFALLGALVLLVPIDDRGLRRDHREHGRRVDRARTGATRPRSTTWVRTCTGSSTRPAPRPSRPTRSGNGRTGTYTRAGRRPTSPGWRGGARVHHRHPGQRRHAQQRRPPASTRRRPPRSRARRPCREIIWFKAPSTYTAGGKLIGFETPRTGVAVAGGGGTYDRHLYMDGNGRVWFGVYNGAT